MKTGKAKDNKSPEMPFQVDHKLRVNIETQVTDGIRQAILSGFYKPGDFLPKAVDLTRGLHVSIRATKAAYRTLKREGLISPRRRLGTVVVGRKADVFHGRVVIVNQNSNPFYSDAVTPPRRTSPACRKGRRRRSGSSCCGGSRSSVSPAPGKTPAFWPRWSTNSRDCPSG